MTMNKTAVAIVTVLAIGSVFAAEARDLCIPLAPESTPGPLAVRTELSSKSAAEAPTSTYEEEIVVLVNQERWNNGGRPPLKSSAQLETSAEGHSSDMALANFFMHCNPDTGSTASSRIAATGYPASSAAENIAAGFLTPTDVMAAWMASGGHQANILSTSYREIGVGYYFQSGDQGNVRENPPTGACPASSSNNGPYQRYWTQNFGRNNNHYPVVINREAIETDSRNVDLYVYGTTFSEMRFRNEAGAWSGWQSFANDTTWQLSSGTGTKTVHAEMRIGSTVYSASDTIHLEDDGSEIFSDGFESGNATAWSETLP